MALILLLLAAAMAAAQVQITPSFSSNGPVTISVTPVSRGAAAITGAPYSGDRTSERILSDNTRMSQSVAHEYRDSSGRFRAEHSGYSFGALTIVEITDPVAGFAWVLDPVSQTAYRTAFPRKTHAGLPTMRCDPGGDPTTSGGAGENTMTTQRLGSRTINGIEACGQLTKITRKDGSAGVTNEVWNSRENVGGLVLLKLGNPDGSQSITELVNVKFNEPDPGLFLPPAGYKVVEQSSTFTITDSRSPAVPAGKPADMQKFVALTGMPWSGDYMSVETVINRHYRDSSGRTRVERFGGTVTIVDPVGGYSYTLDSSRKTAQRRSITATSKPASEASAPAPDGMPQTLANGVKALTESLGTKTIDGVATFGIRTTLTYPPGSIGGNISTTTGVTETWASPQLGTAVMIHSSGAIGSTSTAALANIKYSEPDPALFRVPEGYQIIDEK